MATGRASPHAGDAATQQCQDRGPTTTGIRDDASGSARFADSIVIRMLQCRIVIARHAFSSSSLYAFSNITRIIDTRPPRNPRLPHRSNRLRTCR